MRYFEHYVSNTTAGSGNQHIFCSDNHPHTGRVFYRIEEGGTYAYSFLFSNILDSTFADGSVSHKNMICDEWEILEARVGGCQRTAKAQLDAAVAGKEELPEITDWKQVTFGGKKAKTVNPGEFFCSDDMFLSFESGAYLCLELTFSGKIIPYHEESLLPVFVQENGEWQYCKRMPFAGMIGCQRSVKARIGFIGDSITQGIGTACNSYEHWNARLAAMLGCEYAYWNLGLGFGRANDIASDGAWMYKAKQNEVLVVCYGVNDMLHEAVSAKQLIGDLTAIVTALKKEHKKILLQTIPPFEYEGQRRQVWQEVNEYIKTKLAEKVDAVFDVVPILGEDEAHAYHAKYGAHPNKEGCYVWADALYPVLKQLLDNIDEERRR